MDWTPVTPEQRLEIIALLDAGLTCREIKERLGLKYVMQVAGVKAGLTRKLNATAERDEEDTQAEAEAEAEIGGEPVDPSLRVDTSDVLRVGRGCGIVYAYGYRGLDNALKIGRADGSVEERIARQICTGSPGKPMLVLEIRTGDCRKLERALHAVLDLRGRKIVGGGSEWFAVTRDEVVALQATL